MPAKEWDPGLTGSERAELLKIARDTLVWCTGGDAGQFNFGKYLITAPLCEKYATFVTLHQASDLRGCIGSLEPEAELYRSVHDNTINAALRDFRFPSVSPDEVSSIHIAVSILSPIKPVSGVEEFEVGRDGIIMEKGMHRAVFLPEVATEQGWTREDTLSHLSSKAGLRPDAWRDGCRFLVFQSFKLEE